MLWSKSHIVALLVIGAALFLMIKYTGLKIWHAVVVLAIGAYITAFIFGPQITTFLSKEGVVFGHLGPAGKKEKPT